MLSETFRADLLAEQFGPLPERSRPVITPRHSWRPDDVPAALEERQAVLTAALNEDTDE